MRRGRRQSRLPLTVVCCWSLLSLGACQLFDSQTWRVAERWPTAGWATSTPEREGLSGTVLADLGREIASGEFGYVDSMLVVRNGYLVIDRSYAHDYREISQGRDMSAHQYNYFHPDWHPYYQGRTVHTLQSVTKSITSILIGIAIGRGELAGTQERMLSYFAEYQIAEPDDRKLRVTIEDMLTMRSGLDWHETDIPPEDPRNTTVQLEASDDWVQFSLDRPMAHDPGTVWVYNSGTSQLLGAILKKATGQQADEYAEARLFRPLGIREYHWKRTPTGLADTEGGLYLNPRDLAKIGYLILKGGTWGDQRIFPREWVATSTERRVEDVAPDNPNWNWGYAYQWWRLDQGATRVFAALGYGGQYLLVLPDHDLIGVITSWNVFGPHRNVLGPFLEALVESASGSGASSAGS